MNLNKNQESPSAFIPFCAFGGNILGEKIDTFRVPVCNIFQPRVLNDQLCYETDLNNITNKKTIGKDIKVGLVFVMDYNEDRQVTFEDNSAMVEEDAFVKMLMDHENDHDAMIHLDTIGNDWIYFIFREIII